MHATAHTDTHPQPADTPLIPQPFPAGLDSIISFLVGRERVVVAALNRSFRVFLPFKPTGQHDILIIYLPW
jgi:hypothetical protein